MANRYRGEARLEVGGTPYTLRLTLGALAALETTLAATDFAALTNRLLSADLSARQLQTVLEEALVAGGDTDRHGARKLLAQCGAPLTLRAAYVDLMRATFAGSTTQ